MVQPLPSEWTSELNTALRRIASNPGDAAALLQAGKASLRLGDIDAATGFFTRAQQSGSVGGQATAGLAAAQVYQKRPVEALQLFKQAESEGASLSAYAGEYGLAYDLVGDNARAQQYYRMALADRADPEITRRLALSLAIAGDRMASEEALLPQLQRQDLAGYRTRAFALAVLGRTEEAVAIVDVVMPASLAGKISPYLRYMPRLTRAQQAAAGNFGHFPDAASIGQDDPRIAAYSNAVEGQPTTPGLDARLIPSGEPLGQLQQPVAPPTQAQVTQTTNVASAVVSPAAASPPRLSAAASSVTAQGQPAPPRKSELGVLPGTRTAEILGVLPESRAVETSELRPAAPAAPIPSAPAPSGELPPIPGQESSAALPPTEEPPPAPMPEPSPALMPEPASEPTPAPVLPQTPTPAPEAELRSLAQAFSDFGPPDTDAVPAPGAVDITAIKPAREVIKKPAPPPKPVIPSRVWVQVATGKDRSALAFDWRRIARSADKLLAGKSAYIAKWGQTNRLVTGPFASENAANKFVKDLKDAGVDSFTFTSAEGEALDPLPSR